MGKKIRIDLSKLYRLAEDVGTTPAKLLKHILEYYDLKYDVIYTESPDFERTIILRRGAYTIEFGDVDTKKVRKECRGVIVELFDGYETAFTCINR